jgi:hypothetical protein
MMDDSGKLRQGKPTEGLCATCRHARRVANDRGSVFVMCEKSKTDRRFPRYPRLPVQQCAGYEPTLTDL